MSTHCDNNQGHTTFEPQQVSAQRAVAKQIDNYLHDQGGSISDFALDVADAYAARVMPDERVQGVVYEGDPNSGKLHARWQIRHVQRTNRQVKCENTAQFDVIWNGWLPALPESYRAAALQDLCASHGVLPIPMPDEDLDHSDLASLCEEDGKEIQGVSEILADGVVDEADIHRMPGTIQSLGRAASRSLSIKRVLQKKYRSLTGKNSEETPLKAVK